MTLESFLQQAPSSAIVTIPAGTRIPLKVRIDGDLVQDKGEFTLPLVLARPIEVVVVDGKPNGIFRGAEAAWKQRSHSLWIRGVQFGATLVPTGPEASVSMTFSVNP